MIFLSAVFFTLSLITFSAIAEILSVPENCLMQEVSPCLLKAGAAQDLKGPSQKFVLAVGSDTIVKILKFESPFQFELLQGKMRVQMATKKAQQFSLNGVQFDARTIFVQLDKDHHLKAYDIKKFLLSEYEPALQKGHETVLRKSEFLAKHDTIRFLSAYFTTKKSLLAFLKSIEAGWQKEFRLQTNDQTIALRRSIASIEQAEAENKRQKQREAEELKKVRSRFFYRTFYR